jgi:Inhibitor of Apoptosis domain
VSPIQARVLASTGDILLSVTIMQWQQQSIAKHLRRLATFASWPSSRCEGIYGLTTSLTTSAVVLASSGFQYTGRGDVVTCSICRIEIDGWLRPDSKLSDPRLEHRKRSPLCPLARECTSPVPCSDTLPSNSWRATSIGNDNEDTRTSTPLFGNRRDISADGNVTSACPFKR